MATLDTSQPYGTVCPPAARLDGVAFYEQDGKLFDKDGQELSPEIATALAAVESEENHVARRPSAQRTSVLDFPRRANN